MGASGIDVGPAAPTPADTDPNTSAPQTIFGHRPFRGTYPAKLEASGRLSIPSPFRHAFSGPDATAIVQPSTEFIRIYTPTGFDRMVDAVSERQPDGMIDPRTRLRFYKFSPEVSIDRQFRFVIPPEMREKVGFGEELMISGAIEVIEVWLPDAFAVEAARADDIELLMEGHSGLPTES